MEWEDKSYAKKGGIIAITIYFIGFVVISLLGMNGQNMQIVGISTFLGFSIPLFSGWLVTCGGYFLENCSNNPNFLVLIIVGIVMTVVYFLIGALIGWIVGKIKKK